VLEICTFLSVRIKSESWSALCRKISISCSTFSTQDAAVGGRFSFFFPFLSSLIAYLYSAFPSIFFAPSTFLCSWSGIPNVISGNFFLKFYLLQAILLGIVSSYQSSSWRWWRNIFNLLEVTNYLCRSQHNENNGLTHLGKMPGVGGRFVRSVWIVKH